MFSANHDQVGNRAFGDRLPAEARPLAALCTLLSPFTPMLFQGEEHGERAPFQFFSDHIDEEIATATREGRRREFAAFAEFRGAEVPDPQDPATFERSKLTRDGRAGGPARPLRGAAARPPRAAGRRRRRRSTFDEHAGWLRVDRGPYALLATSPARDIHVPVDGTVELVAGHAPRHARAGLCRPAPHCPAPWCARLSAVRAVWPGRPFPLGASLGRERDELLAVLRARGAGRAVPVRRGRQRGARIEISRAHRVQLARLPAGRRPGPALRLPRARAVRPAVRAPLQPGEAADRSVRQVDRGQGALEPRERAPVRRRNRTRATTPTSSATTRTPRSRSPSAW